MPYQKKMKYFEDTKELSYMSLGTDVPALGQTVAQLGLIFERVLYHFLRPLGASYIREGLIFESVL